MVVPAVWHADSGQTETLRTFIYRYPKKGQMLEVEAKAKCSNTILHYTAQRSH